MADNERLEDGNMAQQKMFSSSIQVGKSLSEISQVFRETGNLLTTSSMDETFCETGNLDSKVGCYNNFETWLTTCVTAFSEI